MTALCGLGPVGKPAEEASEANSDWLRWCPSGGESHLSRDRRTT